MKIYDYSGRANISGDRIHQARTAQRLSQDALAAKMPSPPRCRSAGLVLVGRPSAASRPATAS